MTKVYKLPAKLDHNSPFNPFSKKQKNINFALQGGGIFGAYTWGVLDQFLSCKNLVIGGISGTSAGAFNAIAMADGLIKGGSKQARQNLHQIWQAIQKIAFPSNILQA